MGKKKYNFFCYKHFIFSDGFFSKSLNDYKHLFYSQQFLLNNLVEMNFFEKKM